MQSSQTHIITIGRTNYYSVRKGTQQYCIAEGRRVQDAGYCWQVVKDPESGKNFFVNGNGVRRWHLPDIYQTEKERLEEERELRFLRELKKKRSAKKKEGDNEDSGEDDDDKKSVESAPVAGGHKPEDIDVEDMRETFASRDRAAAALPMLRGWETPADRKPVVRFAKSVLRPYVTQGLVSEDLFSQLVMTGTREFCSQYQDLGAEKETFRESLAALAQARVDEEARREEYLKMNNDLVDKVKRLDDERRQLTTDYNSALKTEEKMREELFQLRAHKQDVLLHSFKRLTKGGLVQAYWERWVRYKSIVETQMHIKARERRTLEMKKKIVSLEETIEEREKEMEHLRDLERQRQGKEVINRILKQLGKETLRRFYVRWLKHTLETKRSKEMQSLRRQIADCPRCVERGVDVRRFSDDLREKIREIAAMNTKMVLQQESLSRLELSSRALQALSTMTSEAYIEVCYLAQEAFADLKVREKRFVTQDEKVKQMTREIDGLRFEVSTGGRRGGENTMGDSGGDFETYDDDLDESANVSSRRGKVVKRSGGGVTARTSGTSGDGALTSYFHNDATEANNRLELRSMQRTTKLAGEKPLTLSLSDGPHGYIQASTQSAIAPRVIDKVDAHDGTPQAVRSAPPARHGAMAASGLGRQPSTVLVTPGNSSSLIQPSVQEAGDINVRFDVQRSQWYREAQFANNPRAGLTSPFDERTNELRPPSDSDDDSSSGSDSSSVSPPNPDVSVSPARQLMNTFQQEQLRRKNQADVLHFIRPPPADVTLSKGQHNSLHTNGAAPPPFVVPEVDLRCDKCGFRFESAPFCPKDGSRHAFKSLNLNIPHDSAISFAGGPPLPSGKKISEQRQSALNPPSSLDIAREAARATAAPSRTFHDDLTGMLVLPEKVGTTTQRLQSTNPEEAAQYLHLPPGRRPAPTGIQPPSPPRTSVQHPLVERHQSFFASSTSALRDSLDLNPRNFMQPKIYGAENTNGKVGITSIHNVAHPRDLNDGGAAERDADYRETLDHIRSTRITTENTRRIVGKQTGASGLGGINDERSIIAGYNPSADPDNALSLQSRLFSTQDPMYGEHLLDAQLEVPNYFNAATSSFASRSGNFATDRVVSTQARDKNVPDSHRVMQNIKSFNQRETASDPEKRTSGWGQLFQYTDVLYEDRLGVKALDPNGTFGTQKESMVEKPTAAELLGRQHRSRPNMEVQWRK